MVIDSGKVTASDAHIQPFLSYIGFFAQLICIQPHNQKRQTFRTLLLMKNAPKQETETEGNHYETLRT